jgi:hypothetical protein
MSFDADTFQRIEQPGITVIGNYAFTGRIVRNVIPITENPNRLGIPVTRFRDTDPDTGNPNVILTVFLTGHSATQPNRRIDFLINR